MTERPLDCSECKKPVAIYYTKIIGNDVSHTIMCADCPHLERQLYGVTKKAAKEGEGKVAELSCGNCGTSFEEIRLGHPLGCAECYDIFPDVIIEDLLKSHHVSRHLSFSKKMQPLHVGRSPGEAREITSTMRLIALNEALDETLIREDYEQAALLRDQIRDLKEKGKQDEGE